MSGVAVALKQAMSPEFKAYQMQVLANCKALSSALIDHGYKIVTGESHWCVPPSPQKRFHFCSELSSVQRHCRYIKCTFPNLFCLLNHSSGFLQVVLTTI